MDDLINSLKKHGEFNYYVKIQIVIIFILLMYMLNNNATTVVAALILTNLYIKSFVDDTKDMNQQIYMKLQELQIKVYDHVKMKIKRATKSGLKISNEDKIVIFNKNNLDSLYIDANMIEFLYSIIDLNKYNSESYYLLLKGTNNILKLYNEIDIYYKSNKDVHVEDKKKRASFRIELPEKTESLYLENIPEMYNIALDIRRVSINSLHDMIYSVPKNNKMYSYVDKVIERYSVLIDVHLDKIKEYNNDFIKADGINNRTQFLNDKIRNNNNPIIPHKNNKYEVLDYYL